MDYKREFKLDGFNVLVTREDDECPDLSYLGEYRAHPPARGPYYDRALERVVVPGERPEPEGPNEDCPEPECPECKARAEALAAWEVAEREDYSAGEEWSGREYRYIHPGCGDPEYLAQDVKRLESYPDQWCMVGVRARAYRKGVLLGESSCYGIESDSTEEFFKSQEDELAREAVAEAKVKLAELREESA